MTYKDSSAIHGEFKLCSDVIMQYVHVHDQGKTSTPGRVFAQYEAWDVWHQGSVPTMMVMMEQ